MERMSSIVLVGFVSLAAACGNEIASPGTGRSGITLLVTNSTCASGRCDSLQVRGFPNNQPDTPGGLWSIDLGLITTSQACFTLPATAKFYVIQEPTRSSADTTTYTWTSAIPLSLGAYSPSTNFIMVNPITSSFVPADSPGWSIAVPGDKKATASSACTP